MLQISGFDTSARLIGWTSGTGETVPECGSWPIEKVGDDIDVLIEHVHELCVHHLEAFRPDRVVIEAPIHKRTDSLLTMRKLYGVHAHVEWFFSRQPGVIVSEEDPQTIKARVTGNRSAEKSDMVFVARKCGLILPKIGFEDAADSWGAWLLGVDYYNRPFRERWDKRIYGSRGALL